MRIFKMLVNYIIIYYENYYKDNFTSKSYIYIMIYV